MNIKTKIAIMSTPMLMLASLAQGQAVVSLSPVAKQQFFSVAGAPLATGCVNTYQTGTSTPQATYVDSTGTTPNPNPIILDAGGFANVWLTNTTYRFVVVAYDGIPGNKCAAGVTQYTIDGINAFAAINNASNLFLAANTSDPSGTAGEMTYRSDIPCFRFFTTFWDCVVRLTDTQTLTNKTLSNVALTGTTTGLTTTNATLTTPLIIGGTVQSPAILQGYPNNFGSASSAGLLVKLSSVGCTASSDCIVNATTADTGGVIGICVSNCGTTGNGFVSTIGIASCTFDGGTTQGDYVQISGTVAGNCHDSGATYPSSGQVIGRVLTTNGGGGFYNLTLFGTELRPPSGTAAVVNLTAQGANIASTPIFTPVANGYFRFSCYTVITQAATVSSTLPNCAVTYTDADSNFAESLTLTAAPTTNTVGFLGLGSSAGVSFDGVTFFAKSGVAISFNTSGYATNGATPMQYAIHARLEGPF